MILILRLALMGLRTKFIFVVLEQVPDGVFMHPKAVGEGFDGSGLVAIFACGDRGFVFMENHIMAHGLFIDQVVLHEIVGEVVGPWQAAIFGTSLLVLAQEMKQKDAHHRFIGLGINSGHGSTTSSEGFSETTVVSRAKRSVQLSAKN